MKLTINIPDDLYNGIIKNEYELYNGKFFDMIRNGAPLPKGTLLLIDTEHINAMAYVNFEDKTVVDLCDITEFATIVEADKE